MMQIFIFLFVYSILLYFSLTKPEAAVAFCLFFFATNSLIVNGVMPGSSLRAEHVSFLLLFIMTLTSGNFNLGYLINIVKNPIFLAMLIMLIYAVYYDFFYGITEREKYVKNLVVTFLLGLLGLLNLKKITENNNLNQGLFFSSFITIIVWIFIVKIQSFGIENNRDLINEDQLGYNTITLGRDVGFLFCISLFTLLYAKNKLFIILASLMSLFLIYYVFVIGTRGVFVSIIIVFAILFWQNIRRLKVKYLVLSAILMFLAMHYIDFSSLSLFQRFELVNQHGFREESRFLIYAQGVALIIGNNLIPMGPAGFMRATGDYAHNFVIELLVDYGWIAIPIIVMLIYYGLIQSIRIMNHRFAMPAIKIVPLLWIFYLINTMFSGDIIVNQTFFFLSFALIAVIIQSKPNLSQ